MLKSKFCDGKSREERMPGWPMDGVPVKRQAGMIGYSELPVDLASG